MIVAESARVRGNTRKRAAGLFALVGIVTILSSCKVDIRIDVTADDTGAGTIQVTVDVDAEVVTLIPGLAADIRYDDLVSSGWTIEGPLQVNNGGLRVILRYPFESPAEATRALRQISGPNGPLLNPELKRTVDGRLISTTLDATLQFVGGLDTFSDPLLTSAIGGAPWRNAADKLGVTNPMDSVIVTLVARLPGDVKKSTGTEAEGGVIWTAPTDGTEQSVVVGAVTERVDGGFWPVVARVSGTILGYWLILVGAVILLVVLIGRRRPPRRPRAPRSPRETAGVRDPRSARQPLDPRDARDPRDQRDPRYPPEPRDPRVIRPPLGNTGPIPRQPPPRYPDSRTTPDF